MTVQIRLVILFFVCLSLASTGLNSANARFAVILRNKARANYTNSDDWDLDNSFETLAKTILANTVVPALGTGLFSGVGIFTAINLSGFKNHAVCQIIVGLLLISTGGYIADHVEGYQAAFEKFAPGDGIPYYGVIYYGCVAQAVYGSVLILLSFPIKKICDRY